MPAITTQSATGAPLATTSNPIQSVKSTFKETKKDSHNSEQMMNAGRLAAEAGYPIDFLVKEALVHLQHSPMANNPSATFADGVRLYLAKLEQTGVRPLTLMQAKAALRSLEKVFGGRPVVSITESEIESFLALLKNRQGQPGGASTTTKLRTLEYVKSVFRALGFAQPFASVRKPRPTSEERVGKFFDVHQFIEIMSAARPNERGMLAIALIGGIQPLVLERLPADCVDMVNRVIAIPSHFSIEGRAHHLETECVHSEDGRFIPGLPAALWPWLKIYPFEPQPWAPVQRRIAGQVGFWHQNGCRNTAATFYNKLHGMAATWSLLCSEGPSRVICRHYVGVISQSEAERFYSINPAYFLAKAPSK